MVTKTIPELADRRKPHASRGLRRLRQTMRRRRVTLDMVAEAAGVSRAHTSNVLQGWFVSERVVTTAKRLIAERQAQIGGGV